MSGTIIPLPSCPDCGKGRSPRAKRCFACSNRHRQATGAMPMGRGRQPQLVTAWGETKTLVQWASDERAKASVKAIRDRLASGWGAEEAICTRPGGKQ